MRQETRCTAGRCMGMHCNGRSDWRPLCQDKQWEPPVAEWQGTAQAEQPELAILNVVRLRVTTTKSTVSPAALNHRRGGARFVVCEVGRNAKVMSAAQHGACSAVPTCKFTAAASRMADDTVSPGTMSMRDPGLCRRNVQMPAPMASAAPVVPLLLPTYLQTTKGIWN